MELIPRGTTNEFSLLPINFGFCLIRWELGITRRIITKIKRFHLPTVHSAIGFFKFRLNVTFQIMLLPANIYIHNMHEHNINNFIIWGGGGDVQGHE